METSLQLWRSITTLVQLNQCQWTLPVRVVSHSYNLTRYCAEIYYVQELSTITRKMISSSDKSLALQKDDATVWDIVGVLRLYETVFTFLFFFLFFHVHLLFPSLFSRLWNLNLLKIMQQCNYAAKILQRRIDPLSLQNPVYIWCPMYTWFCKERGSSEKKWRLLVEL